MRHSARQLVRGARPLGRLMFMAAIGLTHGASDAAASCEAPSLSAAAKYGTGNAPSAIAVGDFNGDGKADLAVANSGGNTVSVLLAAGNGAFPTVVDYGVEPGPQGLAVGDFNGDGRPDLAVVSPSAQIRLVSILMGNSNGTFQAAATFPTGAHPNSIAVGEFNGDGQLDLVVAGQLQFGLLRGNGNGTFQAATLVTIPGSFSDTALAVGDFNGDDRLDVATSYAVHLGAGNGLFPTSSSYNPGDGPSWATAGDLNGDGKLDLAVSVHRNDGVGGNYYSVVAVLLGNGNGALQAPVPYFTGVAGNYLSKTPFSTAFADVNGDLKLDVVVANPLDESVSVLLGNGDGSFTISAGYATGTLYGPGALAVGDFNGDGRPDVVVANTVDVYPQGRRSDNTVSVMLNTCTSYPPPPPPFGFFDTPVNNATGVQGAIGLTGWALDATGISKLELWRDRVNGDPPPAPNGKIYIGNATFVSGARPDVQAAYPTYPNNDRAGWGYALLTNLLPNVNTGTPAGGVGTFTLYAYVTSTLGYVTQLPTRTFTCDNASGATKPFGTIDTPTQGQTVSGTINNFGWVLTPQPGIIPTNGSTITLFIDGIARGTLTGQYNFPRPDLAGYFPGLTNTNGPVGRFIIDTTTLSNGVHTIAWSVTDSLGRGEGIGSRYFIVLN